MSDLYTLRGWEHPAVPVSRREERHPQGWLGVNRTDPGEISDRGWGAEHGAELAMPAEDDERLAA